MYKRQVSQRVCEFLGVDPKGKKIITCHIGNGGSISAIKDGKCIDTRMGLTPLEGLVMGTRSAVSYTHLDVYKRQGYLWAKTFNNSSARITLAIPKNKVSADDGMK